MTLDNRTHIINNLQSNLGRILAEKLSFKSPFDMPVTESQPPKGRSVASTKHGSVSRKMLNQVLNKMIPQSATNASAKYKPFGHSIGSYHDGTLNRSMKQHHSVDHRESSQKSFKRNNLSLAIDHTKTPAYAYGFSQGQPSPVDRM